MVNVYTLGGCNNSLEYKVDFIKKESNLYSTMSNVIIPDSFNLEKYLPLVKCQGDIPACVAYAVTAAKEADDYKETGKRYKLNELYLHNKITKDFMDGASIRDALVYVKVNGIREKKWLPFNYREKEHRIDSFFRWYIEDCVYNNLRIWIYNKKSPIVCSLLVNDWWFNNETMADLSTYFLYNQVLNLHCVLLIGYFIKNNIWYYIFRNSWGEEWKEGGNCVIPELILKRILRESWGVYDSKTLVKF